MKRIITILAVLVLSAAFVTTAEAKKAKATPEETFKQKDSDNDGFLTKKEFTAGAKDAAKAEKQFDKIAKGADKISKDDFVKAMSKHKKKN